jgi:hypothetical protein
MRPLRQPMVVSPLTEQLRRLGLFRRRRGFSHPDRRLLEGAQEALATAVAFRFASKSGRGLYGRKTNLAAKAVARESGSPVMLQRHAASDALKSS